MSRFNALKTLLPKENKAHVQNYIDHCVKSQSSLSKKSIEQIANDFLKVKSWGLVFDGVNVTHGYRGIDCNYKAYKNRMLHIYPESSIDMQLVFKGDTFNVSKESGTVIYTHIISQPFNQEDSRVVGGYCVIKNKRGHFITMLSNEEILKHKKVAKTKNIWNAWYKEMALKTVIKKAVGQHFEDIFIEMNEEDNKQIDLNLLTSKDVEAAKAKNILIRVKSDLDACKKIQDVLKYEADNPELKKNIKTAQLIEAAKTRTVEILKAYISNEVKDAKTLGAIWDKAFASYKEQFDKVAEPPMWWVSIVDLFDNRTQELG